ncbi:Putative ribonuclease H protein At1g65750 [Linum perenne]
MLNDVSSESGDPIWPLIWRWHGPNKIKHFLWIASHNRLLTNEERGRRHITNKVFCPRCSSISESSSHMLLDCPFAMQVWMKVLPRAASERGNHRDFGSWWVAMLQDKENNIKFGITAWLLWSARNKLIFENLVQSASSVGELCEFWTSLVLSSWKTNQLGREAPGLARQTQLIAWRPGEEGWATLNTDGSRLHRSGATAIGGLIRDERGKFVRAFCANVGDCSITRAELRAIVEGVKMAWNLGFRKVAVQTDSRAAIAILQTGIGLTSQHAALVAEFHELKMKDWEISLSHIYREANCATDHLANFGHSFCVGLYEFNTPDSSLASWLRHDLLGVALPRVVSNNN